MLRIIVATLLALVSSSSFAGDFWKREARYFVHGYVQDTMYLGYQHQQLQLQGYQAALGLYYEDTRAKMEAERRREEQAYQNRERCSYTYNEKIVNGVAVQTEQGRNCKGTREEPWVVGTTSVPYQSGPVTVGKPVSVASAPTLAPEVQKRLADNEVVRLQIELARAQAKAKGN